MSSNNSHATQSFDPSELDHYTISVSDTAKTHILNELKKADGKSGFRLFLETSGCSGFMYETELAEQAGSDDQIYHFGELQVFVPKKDLAVLNGTEIDFIKVGLNSMFQFKNPNVTGECGCGESFSVTEDDE